MNPEKVISIEDQVKYQVGYKDAPGLEYGEAVLFLSRPGKSIQLPLVFITWTSTTIHPQWNGRWLPFHPSNISSISLKSPDQNWSDCTSFDEDVSVKVKNFIDSVEEVLKDVRSIGYDGKHMRRTKNKQTHVTDLWRERSPLQLELIEHINRFVRKSNLLI